MSAKIVLSVYVDVEKDSEEVSAMVSDLVERLGGNIVTKPAKPRKARRPMTDEQKAAFRARMVAGREAKSKANSQEDADIDANNKKTAGKANSTTGRKSEGKLSTK